MMAQMQKAGGVMDHHATAPAKGGKADNPCKPGLTCQMSTGAPVLSEAPAVVVLTADAADLSATYRDGGPSRPPDRSLRPPIKL